MHRSHTRKGEHLFVCDRCGFIYHSHNKAKEWTGLVVCKGPETNNCWEPRHPQDFVRGVADDQTVNDPRPDEDPQYIGTDRYPNGVTADDL